MLADGPTTQETWLWHRRMGHTSPGYLKSLFPKLFVPKNFSCETCVLAKSHRNTFKPNDTRVKTVFSLIHSDVWGPAPVGTSLGFKYFVIFVDDCSRATWVYFMKQKSEVVDKFILFYKMIQTQFQTSIKILRSDNGGKFVNNSMSQFFRETG